MMAHSTACRQGNSAFLDRERQREEVVVLAEVPGRGGPKGLEELSEAVLDAARRDRHLDRAATGECE